MTAPLGIAVFFTIWWVVLFAVLPFGIGPDKRNGSEPAVPGADPGAPARPRLLKKAIWTTAIAAVLFASLDAYMLWAA